MQLSLAFHRAKTFPSGQTNRCGQFVHFTRSERDSRQFSCLRERRPANHAARGLDGLHSAHAKQNASCNFQLCNATTPLWLFSLKLSTHLIHVFFFKGNKLRLGNRKTNIDFIKRPPRTAGWISHPAPRRGLRSYGTRSP